MSQALKEAREAMREAERKVEAVLRADYPVGGRVAWEKAGRKQAGTIWQHAYGERVKVRNDRTGAILFIHAYDIVAAL